MLTLEEMKLYLRIDGDEEDPELHRLLEAVKGYMVAGIGEELDFSDRLAKQACLMLMAHWYENRGIVGDDAQIPLGYNSIAWLLQAKYGGVKVESGQA